MSANASIPTAAPCHPGARATIAALATHLEDAALALYDATPDDALLDVIALAAERRDAALRPPDRPRSRC